MVRDIPFADRNVRCRNAHESTYGILECPNGHKEHGRVYVALAVDSTAPAGRAWYGSYSADEAREIAALLLELADDIDGKTGLQ